MVHVYIVSHVDLPPVLRSGEFFCLLKNGHFPLPHAPEQLLAEKAEGLVLLSASTLGQDAPEGLGSEELPKTRKNLIAFYR